MIHYTKNEPVGEPAYYTCMIGRACIGTLGQEVDGYYYWIPRSIPEGGVIASWVLKDLYMKLEALNEAWDQKIGEELTK